MLSHWLPLIVFVLFCSASHGQILNPSFETVSRCFFVYAPITEFGRDLPHPQLFQFGQPRIGWVTGYIQANQSNSTFKQVFEANIGKNKEMAVQLESSLRRAISARSQAAFSSVMDQAIACDRALGIRTSVLPSL